MKKLLFTICIFLTSVILFLMCKPGKKARESVAKARVEHQFEANIDSLDRKLNKLKKSVLAWDSARAQDEDNSAAADSSRQLFKESRMAFKEVEFLLAYYYPSVAKQINGPALDHIAFDDPNQTVIPPQGFQVIEEYLFPEATFENKKKLANEIEVLRVNLNRVKKYEGATRFTDMHIFDAMRMELLRVMSLGISGFDSPVAFHSIPEAEASLKSLVNAFQAYEDNFEGKNKELVKNTGALFDKAIRYLNKNTNFNGFDRLHFIKEFGIPISEHIFKSQHALQIALPDYQRPWKAEAPSVFSRGAFDAYAFAPAYVSKANDIRIELGRHLFYDSVLSGAGGRSCATCHQPGQAFTDGLARSKPLESQDDTLRNAPTLINAALQNATFYDMRTQFLEDQISDVVTNTSEMHGSFDEAVGKLSKDETYVSRFSDAFPDDSTAVTQEHIRIALADYLRTLEGLSSPFDRYLRGDENALTAVEKKGFNLFMGKAKCGTCHFVPLFNGTLPPSYTDTESEVLGVPEQADTVNATIDPDVGKYVLHGSPLDKFAFKTPTVRNAELTAPYMHNGVYETLEEVVDFYNRGGGHGIGIELSHQTLPTDSLKLSPQEEQALVAFMEALTDTSGLTQKPKQKINIAEN